jgi:hypothetical protein
VTFTRTLQINLIPEITHVNNITLGSQLPACILTAGSLEPPYVLIIAAPNDLNVAHYISFSYIYISVMPYNDMV